MGSDDVEKRALRAELLVQVGELSSARQALEGAALAPGTHATLDALNDATRRPPHLRTPLSPEVLEHVPRREFELDEPTFNKNSACSAQELARCRRFRKQSFDLIQVGSISRPFDIR